MQKAFIVSFLLFVIQDIYAQSIPETKPDTTFKENLAGKSTNTTDSADIVEQENSDNEDDSDEIINLENLSRYSENVYFLNINLKVSPLQKLPSNVKEFPNLSMILIHNLPAGGLFDFQSSILALTFLNETLTDLYIFNNGKGFTVLPPAIGEIKSLRILRLFSNGLTSIPEEIGKLQNLQELSVERNNLHTLPASIAKLKNLKRLGLEDNPIPLSEIQKLKALLPKCKITYSK